MSADDQPTADIADWRAAHAAANQAQRLVAVEGRALNAVVTVDPAATEREINVELARLTATLMGVYTGRLDAPRVDQDGEGR